MRTEICDRLNCQVPIFAFTHCRDVVVEVTKAGGFGVLGAVSFSPEQLERELNWIDSHVDGRAYGVDVLIPARYDKAAENPGFISGTIPGQAQKNWLIQTLKNIAAQRQKGPRKALVMATRSEEHTS